MELLGLPDVARKSIFWFVANAGNITLFQSLNARLTSKSFRDELEDQLARKEIRKDDYCVAMMEPEDGWNPDHVRDLTLGFYSFLPSVSHSLTKLYLGETVLQSAAKQNSPLPSLPQVKSIHLVIGSYELLPYAGVVSLSTPAVTTAILELDMRNRFYEGYDYDDARPSWPTLAWDQTTMERLAVNGDYEGDYEAASNYISSLINLTACHITSCYLSRRSLRRICEGCPKLLELRMNYSITPYPGPDFSKLHLCEGLEFLEVNPVYRLDPVMYTGMTKLKNLSHLHLIHVDNSDFYHTERLSRFFSNPEVDLRRVVLTGELGDQLIYALLTGNPNLEVILLHTYGNVPLAQHLPFVPDVAFKLIITCSPSAPVSW